MGTSYGRKSSRPDLVGNEVQAVGGDPSGDFLQAQILSPRLGCGDEVQSGRRRPSGGLLWAQILSPRLGWEWGSSGWRRRGKWGLPTGANPLAPTESVIVGGGRVPTPDFVEIAPTYNGVDGLGKWRSGPLRGDDPLPKLDRTRATGVEAWPAMSEIRSLCLPAAEPDVELLENVQRGMAITADLTRSDLLLVCPRNAEQVVVVAQAQPRSITSLYADTELIGKTLTRQDSPIILEAWRRSWPMRAQRQLMPSSAPIVQHVYPIRGQNGEPLAFLSMESSLIQVERHKSRRRSFRHAVRLAPLDVHSWGAGRHGGVSHRSGSGMACCM